MELCEHDWVKVGKDVPLTPDERFVRTYKCSKCYRMKHEIYNGDNLEFVEYHSDHYEHN